MIAHAYVRNIGRETIVGKCSIVCKSCRFFVKLKFERLGQIVIVITITHVFACPLDTELHNSLLFVFTNPFE